MNSRKNGSVARQKPRYSASHPRPPRRKRAVDMRTREYRRWNALYQDYLFQCPRQEQLCRQAATLVCQRELLDNALARGELVNPDHLIRLSGAISRTLERLGLAQPRARGNRWDAVLDALKEQEEHVPA